MTPFAARPRDKHAPSYHVLWLALVPVRTVGTKQAMSTLNNVSCRLMSIDPMPAAQAEVCAQSSLQSTLKAEQRSDPAGGERQPYHLGDLAGHIHPPPPGERRGNGHRRSPSLVPIHQFERLSRIHPSLLRSCQRRDNGCQRPGPSACEGLQGAHAVQRDGLSQLLACLLRDHGSDGLKRPLLEAQARPKRRAGQRNPARARSHRLAGAGSLASRLSWKVWPIPEKRAFEPLKHLNHLGFFRVLAKMGKWRRRRDSNPRDGFPPTPLAGERLRPLGHVSAEGYSLALVGVTRRNWLYSKFHINRQDRTQTTSRRSPSVREQRQVLTEARTSDRNMTSLRPLGRSITHCTAPPCRTNGLKIFRIAEFRAVRWLLNR